jgi:3',5'-cyclic-AMP phosphodiesterase
MWGRRPWTMAIPGLALALAACVAPAAGDGGAVAASFSFAQAADTHVTDAASVAIVDEAVDRINTDPALAFSLWLGDLTRQADPGEMALAHRALERLEAPWYTVRGNHDLAGGTFEREFGPLRQTFDHGGWRFILVDSNPGDATPMSEHDCAFIRHCLARTPADMPLVLCCHHPLMPGTKAYPLAGAEDVIALFACHNLRAVLNGHYHGNQEAVVDGVLYTTTACCSTTRDNFDGATAKGYRVFHCTGDEISTEFVVVRDAPEPDADGQ